MTGKQHVYEEQFDAALDTGGVPARTLIIASTPRSGSHMLGHSMIETGVMGRPFEYVAPRNLARWKEMLGTSDVWETLREIMKRRTTPNGVFAIKLHREHVFPLGGIEKIEAFFPNPVYLRILRGNLLSQAISMSAALQDDVWISGMQGNGKTAIYDRRLIRQTLERLAVDNAVWDKLLAGRPAMTVEYSEVVRDLQGTLRRISAFTGLPIPPEAMPEQPPTRPQATSRSDEWLERYRREWQPSRRVQLLQRALRELRYRLS